MTEATTLDAVDVRLLAHLRAQGRATWEELGGELGLSPSTVLRRVRRLEEAGAITGYAVQVDARCLGLNLSAYVQVRMVKHASSARHSPLEAFAAAAQSWPEVIECVSLTGEMDCLLKVMVRDMDAFSHFVMDRLLRHPSVQDCKSSFVMKTLKATAPVAPA